MMMKKAPIRTVPWIIGRSAFTIESYASLPTPGMLKTVSTRIVPPSRIPMSSPAAVTTGVIALRSPWRKITRRSRSPFARAVRM